VIAPDSIHSYDMQNDFKALGSVSLGSKAKYVDSGSYELPDGYEVPPIDPRYDPMPLDGFGID
jgi:hypothetical protein